VDWLVERLEATTVLEPGCGGGRMLEALADRSCQVVAMRHATRLGQTLAVRDAPP
jgi:2-polyprenyl-3-methyl-5-hydroxy-6-metoxy-1,4-benzoquinol methylase